MLGGWSFFVWKVTVGTHNLDLNLGWPWRSRSPIKVKFSKMPKIVFLTCLKLFWTCLELLAPSCTICAIIKTVLKIIWFDANRTSLWNESKQQDRSKTGHETVSSTAFDCEHWECWAIYYVDCNVSILLHCHLVPARIASPQATAEVVRLTLSFLHNLLASRFPFCSRMPPDETNNLVDGNRKTISGSGKNDAEMKNFNPVFGPLAIKISFLNLELL